MNLSSDAARAPVKKHCGSRRRCALAGLFGALPHIALAQGSNVVRRIGLLNVGAPPEREVEWAALRDLGWAEGRNLHVERRYANGQLEKLPTLAEELLRAKVEVIVADGPNPTRAAMRSTTTTPIVFLASDPVGNGLVSSLARPGGNVTGFAATSPELDAKLMSLLKELVPSAHRVGLLETFGNPYFRLRRPLFQNSCRLLGLEPVSVEIAAASDIDSTVARHAQQGLQALVIVSDSFTLRYGSEVIRAALKRALPTIADQSHFVREHGALISYEGSRTEISRRWASYVDRILRGSKPADLPVEEPTQFNLVINLKVARTLAIAVPPSFMLRATEIIQ